MSIHTNRQKYKTANDSNCYNRLQLQDLYPRYWDEGVFIDLEERELRKNGKKKLRNLSIECTVHGNTIAKRNTNKIFSSIISMLQLFINN